MYPIRFECIFSGIITRYNLYHNGLLAFTNPFLRTYTLRDLQPWSLHMFRVEACTAKGCGSSEVIQARTQEAKPEGFVGLKAEVVTSRSTKVMWTALERPNGDLTYNVYYDGLHYKDAGTAFFAEPITSIKIWC